MAGCTSFVNETAARRLQNSTEGTCKRSCKHEASQLRTPCKQHHVHQVSLTLASKSVCKLHLGGVDLYIMCFVRFMKLRGFISARDLVDMKAANYI